MAKNILKEAIADAKAVREVALANAKLALEEAFTPKIQNMLSAKLSEELDEGYEDEEEIDLDELVTFDPNQPGDEGSYDINQDTPWDSTSTDDFDDDDYNTMDTLATVDITIGDEGEEEYLEEEIDLEEIINELELDEGNIKGLDEAKKPNQVHEGCKNCDKDFDLDILLEEISSLDKNRNPKEVKTKPNTSQGPVYNQLKATQKALNSSKNELNEAKKALRKVKSELNEINLLNSKLLYVNRIFKSSDLDDDKKLRVVEALDKAESVKEAKLIYETIKGSFSITKNDPTARSIKENFGMASRAAGVAKAPMVITEADNMAARMQKLANIKINQ